MVPTRGDRWGTAGPPSNRMQFAMSGGFYLGEHPPERRALQRHHRPQTGVSATNDR
jgi:hypothetical protein